MRIAVIHFNEEVDNDYGAYFSTLLDEVAEKNEYSIKDHFLLRLRKEKVTGKNIVIHFQISTKSLLVLSYWFSAKLPQLLKKYEIEKVVSLSGMPVNTLIPQLLIIGDIGFFKSGKKSFIQKIVSKKLQKQLPENFGFITYSKVVKQTLISDLNLPEEKVICLPYSVPQVFHPREWHDKLYLKSKHAENKEYFIGFLGEEELNLFTLLLKSFSEFKKWQNSNMKLLILPKEEGFSGKIKNKLSTYKYREDVRLVEDAEKWEVAEMVACAYALIHFPVSDFDLLAITMAMVSAVPSICTYTQSSAEYIAKGGVLIEEKESKEIGQQLIKIYKDEQGRTKMADEAEENSVQYLQKYVSVQLAEVVGILP